MTFNILSRNIGASAPDITICLSAYQSAAIVDRAINFARGQTHERIRILISIDRSTDHTEAVCRAFEREDPRITVIHQHEHLGWAGNANYLLSQVDTEFYFFYFHDDIILPQYAARLRTALLNNPAAATAHCDMAHFGGSDHVSTGLSYPGDIDERLMMFFAIPDRGSPLRAMTRRDKVGEALRMPTDAPSGLWANEPYLTELIAAGPALHVPETLYLRWDERKGGLTDSWKVLSYADQLAGYQRNAASVERTIRRNLSPGAKRDAVRYAFYLHYLLRVRRVELTMGMPRLTAPSVICPDFPVDEPHSAIALYSDRIRSSIRWAQSQIEQLETQIGSISRSVSV